MNLIKIIVNKIGLDKSIAYTSLGRIIQAVGTIVSALFIARYLTGIEQGFYYTFGSLLAVQTFFELGLNGIITQYVAHEMSHLKWNGKLLEGDERYKSRLASLLHFSVKWYLSFALILLITLLVVGFIFFSKYDKSNGVVSWRIPWVLLAISTSMNLILAPLFSFLEGLGKVKDVAKFRFFQQSLGLVIVWLSLSFGAKLLTAGINSLTWVFIALIAFSVGSFGEILKGIWKEKITSRVLYKEEIFPYQWKIALSWISGYFIFQLFNPVLFATEGAVVAGQMGMTLSALNGILSLSLSWNSTKTPIYSGLIALKKYKELDVLFDKTIKQAAFINGSCLILMFFLLYAIKYYHISLFHLYLGDRFLDYFPMIMMMISVFINQYINAWATYLRCHKQEPFLYNSIVGGCLCCISTIGLGYILGVYGITIGYCVITLGLFFWGYRIFETKKNEWHNLG